MPRLKNTPENIRTLAVGVLWSTKLFKAEEDTDWYFTYLALSNNLATLAFNLIGQEDIYITEQEKADFEWAQSIEQKVKELKRERFCDE